MTQVVVGTLQVGCGCQQELVVTTWWRPVAATDVHHGQAADAGRPFTALLLVQRRLHIVLWCTRTTTTEAWSTCAASRQNGL